LLILIPDSAAEVEAEEVVVVAATAVGPAAVVARVEAGVAATPAGPVAARVVAGLEGTLAGPVAAALAPAAAVARVR
jgi:hypothetical protein